MGCVCTKTVKELAIDLGVSKSRVQQVIDKLPITKKPKLVNRKYTLNDENIKDISAFIRNQKKESGNLVIDELSLSYRQLVDNLQEQNRNKDLQIEQLQKLLENQQILLLNEQKEKQLLLESMKIPFWKKINFFKK